MRAVVHDAARQFRVAEIPTPDPAPGQVLVRIVMSGICGTDVHIHQGEYPANFPVVLGHETVGTVAAVGEGVTRFAVGEQVSVNPNLPCDECHFCRSGRPTLCRATTGWGTTRNGFFAEYAAAPQRLVHSVEGLGVETAVFCEPTACVMHGVETLQIKPGATALVVGTGPTGLLLAQLIASGGASSVTVAGPVAAQLETAGALGLADTVLVTRGLPDANQALLLERSHGQGFDIVVEATGQAEVGGICPNLTRSGGTILLYGVARPDAVIGISPYEVFRRELTIKGSYAEATSFVVAIAALRAGRARTDRIITHRFGLEDFGKAIDAAAHDDSAHKVVVVP